MRIHKAIIENYKSIYRPLELELGGGVTLFVGMNNSGKSAILESIANQFQPNPHRSKATMPYEWSVPNTKSVVVLRIQEDFNVAYFRNVEMLFHLYRNGLTTDIDDYLFNIFDNQLPINIELEKYLLNGNVQDETIITEIGGESIYNKSESLQGHYSFIRRINGILEPPQSGYAGKTSELRHIVKEIVNKTTYFCHAKRSVSGVSVMGIQADLKPDFSNLASVLL